MSSRIHGNMDALDLVSHTHSTRSIILALGDD